MGTSIATQSCRWLMAVGSLWRAGATLVLVTIFLTLAGCAAQQVGHDFDMHNS